MRHPSTTTTGSAICGRAGQSDEEVAVLEELAGALRPKVYFAQSVMQNPTGTDITPHAAFKALQAAERHTFTVVEDDIFCYPPVRITTRLPTPDQLNRVIYARSVSETLSGSLRVGFVACAQHIANGLADIKMLTSITASQFTERLAYLTLKHGHYRKYLSRLHEQRGEAGLNVVRLRTHGAGAVRGAHGGHVYLGTIPARR
jgi:DNA-binding transcriptional MocR family regulator